MYHAVTLASKGALWLIGGKWAQNGYHKDTDMVFLNGTVVPGPTLPTARIDLCAVELHDGRVLIMGKPLILVINLVLVVICKNVKLKSSQKLSKFQHPRDIEFESKLKQKLEPNLNKF